MMKKNKTYPFAVTCPMCNGDTDGLVDDYLCMDELSFNKDNMIRIVSHECFTCGEIIGLVVQLIGGKIEILESGKYEQLIKSIDQLKSKYALNMHK